METGYRKGVMKFDELKQQINLVRINEIAAKYKGSTSGAMKYLDVDLYLKRALWSYNKFIKGKGKTIVDLDTRAGYFPFVCEMHGHNTFCTAIAHAFYDDMTANFGVSKIRSRVAKQLPTKLPNMTYDYITCFNANFHCVEGEEWTVSDWEFFLDDMETYLNPGGKIIIQVGNIQKVSAEVVDAFEDICTHYNRKRAVMTRIKQ
jgi:hypothetical protein